MQEKWVELDIIMLSQIILTQKEKYCILFSQMWSLDLREEESVCVCVHISVCAYMCVVLGGKS